MFSSRLPSLRANALSRALATARQSAEPLLDLTESNPTTVGLGHSPGLLNPLADDEGLVYRPDPRGLRSAREAVVAEYGQSEIDPDRVVLWSGTSEAYGAIFKLLCDPGDDVLVPVPSYPLFGLITRLEGVRANPYRLDRSGYWNLDFAAIEAATTPCTRALLVVSPNNPTGSTITRDDRDRLATYCASRDIAIVADEVFSQYPLSSGATSVSMAGESRALTFTLGGLSKSVGLPQVKLAWSLVSGPPGLVSGALEGLDVIADTLLSVGTPVQLAAGRLLASGRAIRDAIRGRLVRNLEALRRAVEAAPDVTLFEPSGGWSAVLRVPAVEAEEAFVLRLLREHRVVVHPGYFFDFDEEAYLIVSLLPEPATFDDGIDRLLSSCLRRA